MPSVDQEAIDRLERKLKRLVANYVEQNQQGPPEEAYLPKRQQKAVRDTLGRVMKWFTDKHCPKQKRTLWPFNNPAIKLKPKFKEIWEELKSQAFPLRGREGNDLIREYGGEPYTGEKYGRDYYGDLCVLFDADQIAANLGCAASTVYKYVQEMIQVGVLEELDRPHHSQHRILRLGWWGAKAETADGRVFHNRRYYLNSTKRRDRIKQALQDLSNP